MAVSVSEIYQSIAVQLYQLTLIIMVITTLCVQIDNFSVIHELLSISVHR